MRFEFSQEDEGFRAEVRRFYQDELPADWDGTHDYEGGGGGVIGRVRKKLADKGWLTMAWPKEYGGLGWSVNRQVIFADESVRARFQGARDPGVGFLGPAIIHHGTEEQKQKFLPPISRAELSFHQGFSEPDAGSDLTGLRTTAKRDGDFYIIKGQKIWGGGLGHADYSFLLARTDETAPKHKGISFFIIPADTPGISYEEFGNLGDTFQNIVYYDNCRVPAKQCLIGEENQGWYIAATVLNFERAVVEYAVQGSREFGALVEWWQEERKNLLTDGRTLAHRHRLAQTAIDIEVCRLLAYRVAWVQLQGQIPTYESSAVKVFGSEMTQRFAHLATNILGLSSEISSQGPASKHRPLKGAVEHNVRYQIGYTLMGGTSEIQRNVIASRGLGLPRS